MMPATTAMLTEEALILRLRSAEHDFVERKSRSDKGDWLQSAVAFANSAPIGWPAVLFVGVDDDGKPQQGPEKLEDLAKSVGDTLDRAYPAIYRHVVPMHLEGGGACLAVVIPGSELRPHFAGKSYIRDGPQTKEASESQFARLIAERQSKAQLILEWKGKPITLETIRNRGTHLSSSASGFATVDDCNQFFVTVRFGAGTFGSQYSYRSIPLEWVELSRDHERNQLKIICEE